MKKRPFPAIFLDRDGTLIEDAGYIWRMNDVRIIPGVIPALKKLQKHFRLIIITNQSGISKGFFTEKQYQLFNTRLLRLFKKKGVRILDSLHCPHRREDNCICHKPSIHFIKVAAAKYHLDLKNSFSVGDHPHDAEMGTLAGAQGIYVLTGHGKKHRNELKNKSAVVFPSLVAAAHFCLQKFGKKFPIA